MSTHRNVARNVICNVAGTATHMLTGFVVAPFLINSLGQARYGLWILICSLTGYFTLLDLGVAGALSRNLAFLRARGDRKGMNALASTGFALLAAVGGLILVGTAVAWVLFFQIVEVPPETVPAASRALWLVGLNLALFLPGQVFTSVLWAHERFDLLNLVLIPAVLLRMVLTFWLVPMGYGLDGLAFILIIVTLAEWAGKCGVAFWVDPGLRVTPGRIRKASARQLWGYGIWYFLLSMEQPLVPQAVNLVIGNRLGAWYVTPFSVASRLTSYANASMKASTQVLTPRATAFYAGEEKDNQRILFLEGGKYCLFLALFFLTLFATLGQSLITLWIGSPLEYAWLALILLAVGELLPMSQWITYGTILGMGRHKALAFASIAEILLTVVLALLFVGPWGLAGACLAFAIPAFLGRGVFQMAYACSLLHVRVTDYLARSLLPAVLFAAPPALALGLMTRWHAPETWPELVGFTAVYAALVAVAGLGLVASPRLRHAWPGRKHTKATAPEPELPVIYSSEVDPPSPDHPLPAVDPEPSGV